MFSGGDMMAKNDYTVSMKNAETSVRMEGYAVTPKMRQQCKQVLSGKTTTAVLINKLDIHDEETLNEAEALATFINASKLEQHPLEGAFNFEHYKTIHHFLFFDLYDWAG